MSAMETALTRVHARIEGRAIARTASASLSVDPAETIGIATVKIVTEEQIQAIAFGALDGSPAVVVRLDPISRDVADLAPFAEFLCDWAERVAAAEGRGRIWVPHADTIEALDILGRRYMNNENAPDEVRRMGEVCRIFAHEATFPGQQAIADTKNLLLAHAITGLAPAEESHLGALLAWFDPAVVDKIRESRDRIRTPASGILANTPDQPDDQAVERCRRTAKQGGAAERARAEAEIADILERAVMREWALMTAGREAFLSLGLAAGGLDALEKNTANRVAYALENGFYAARAPHRIAIELELMQAGGELAEQASIEADAVMRDRATREGRVVRGMVSEVRQARPGRKPCDIVITSRQPVMRLRVSDRIKVSASDVTLGQSNVTGVVRRIEAVDDGGFALHIEIVNGVRSRAILSVNARVDVFRTAYANVRTRIFRDIRLREPWPFFADVAPVLPTSAPVPETPLEIAARRRRPR